MKKITIVCLLLLCFGLVPIVSANSADLEGIRIDQTETDVVVSGNASHDSKQITIQVMDSGGNIIYLDQMAGSAEGGYLFKFPIPDRLRGQECMVLIGGDKISAPLAKTFTIRSTVEPTPSPAPSATPSPGPSATPSPGPSATPSPGPSATPSPAPSATPSPSPSATPSPGPSATPSPAPSATPSPSPSATPSPGPSATPSPGPSATPSPDPSATPSPGPSATPSPAPSATPRPPSNSLPIEWYLPNSNEVKVDERLLMTAVDGLVTIELLQGQDSIVFAAAASGFTEVDTVEVIAGNSAVSIPAAVIQSLLESIGRLGSMDARLVFTIVPVPSNVVNPMAVSADHSSEAIRLASEAYRLEFAVVKNDGTRTVQGPFETPIRLTLPIYPEMNPRWTGGYELTNDREPLQRKYKGGRLSPDELQMVVDIHSSGVYTLLEYDKTFRDVVADHWAYAVIKELSARHVIGGVTDLTFEPERDISRAEFTTLLVNLLQLQASRPASFVDVIPTDWYASSVAAAAEAGIVQGDDLGRFNPAAPVTREEMAIMLLRAYEGRAGIQINVAANIRFTDDPLISEWARIYVNSAAELGLLNGYEDGTFSPKGTTRRSEAAQAVYNFLQVVE